MDSCQMPPAWALWEGATTFSSSTLLPEPLPPLPTTPLQAFPVALLSWVPSPLPGPLPSFLLRWGLPLSWQLSPPLPRASLRAAGAQSLLLPLPLLLPLLSGSFLSCSFFLLSAALWTNTPPTCPSLSYTPFLLQDLCTLYFSFSFPWVPGNLEFTCLLFS